MVDKDTEAGPTIIKIRGDTRRKYELAKRVKRLKFVEVADLAIDALFRADPELRKVRRQVAVA